MKIAETQIAPYSQHHAGRSQQTFGTQNDLSTRRSISIEQVSRWLVSTDSLDAEESGRQTELKKLCGVGIG
jgi:hypothetical protein